MVTVVLVTNYCTITATVPVYQTDEPDMIRQAIARVETDLVSDGYLDPSMVESFRIEKGAEAY